MPIGVINVDFSKAFDRALWSAHAALWQILLQAGTFEHLVWMPKHMYAGQQRAIRRDDGTERHWSDICNGGSSWLRAQPSPVLHTYSIVHGRLEGTHWSREGGGGQYETVGGLAVMLLADSFNCAPCHGCDARVVSFLAADGCYRSESFMPTGICEELVQSRLRSGSTVVGLGWPRSDEASARCTATEMMPLHRWTQTLCAAGRSTGGALAARACASMRRKAAASGAQRPPTSTPKTAVACVCIAEHRAGHNVCTGLRRSVLRDRADDGGIHRNLRAMPERQPIANDLDAPRIRDRHMGVHCCQAHIPPHTRACFLANTGIHGHTRAMVRSKGKARDARTPDGAPQAHLARSGRNSGWGRAAAEHGLVAWGTRIGTAENMRFSEI